MFSLTGRSFTAADRRCSFRVVGGNGLPFGLWVGEGFDAVDLAGFDQRGDATPNDTAFVMACKKSVLAIGGIRFSILVAVSLDTAVSRKGLQPIPVTMDAGQLFSQPGFIGDIASFDLQPIAEGRHQRCAAGRHPQVARFGLVADRFQHRSRCFIHEQISRLLQIVG